MVRHPGRRYERVAARAQDVATRFGPAPSAQRDVPHECASRQRSIRSACPRRGVAGHRGADGTRATNARALSLRDGVLRTGDGAECSAIPRGDARGAVPVPLRVPEIDAALGRARTRTSSATAGRYTRAAIDPRTGTRSAERVTLGRVACGFPPGRRRSGSTRARRRAAGRRAASGHAADGSFRHWRLQPDAGTIDIAAGVAKLDEAYRAFEAIGARFGRRHRYQTTVDS